MCDKDGNIWNDGGQIIGKAELVPESERQGEKEGPFSGFSSPVVTKDGKVADSQGVIIGRLIEGDAKKLYGKEVDPDGDVLDKVRQTLSSPICLSSAALLESSSGVVGSLRVRTDISGRTAIPLAKLNAGKKKKKRSPSTPLLAGK